MANDGGFPFSAEWASGLRASRLRPRRRAAAAASVVRITGNNDFHDLLLM